jgi:hypothetical protein
VVDSLRTDKLLEATGSGAAPTFAALIERGSLIDDCVAPFPSVTPVCNSEIVTGRGADGHWISGTNWYHRVEQRYVEYGSSFEATRAFGLVRTLYDIVYNMNMSHLSDEVETIFEELGDRGLRSACTPFLIYRGRTRHEVGLEGLLRRVAAAASFRHATWGPDELFYGELYASRRVDCKPTLARPGTRDEYSGCVGRELVASDLYDFLLFSLPDNDHHSHNLGPEAQVDSIARADAAFAELAEAGGGLDEFLARNVVLLLADHAQTRVERELPLAEALAADYRVLGPAPPEGVPDLAVSPIARAGAVYVLAEGRRRKRLCAEVRSRLAELEGVDLLAWLADPDGSPVERNGAAGPPGAEAVVERDGRELRFRPGIEYIDRRGRGWAVDGDLEALAAEVRDGRLASDAYPDPFSRLWSALTAPHAGDVLISASEGFELVDWGGVTHCPGGSHGSLAAGDSLGPLLFCGLEPGLENGHSQWTLRDIAPVVRSHFGIGARDSEPTLAPAGALGR